jgi:hypothetical protein
MVMLPLPANNPLMVSVNAPKELVLRKSTVNGPAAVMVPA